MSAEHVGFTEALPAFRLLFRREMIQSAPMKTKQFFAVSAFLAVGVAFAQANDIAKYDPRMALETAVVDTNGVKWIDGRYLPL